MHTETGKLWVNQVRNWHLFLFPTVSSPYKKRQSRGQERIFWLCLTDECHHGKPWHRESDGSVSKMHMRLQKKTSELA